MKIRRWDVLLLCVLLAVGALLLLLPKGDGAAAEILSDGQTVGVYPLDRDRIIPVSGEYGENTVCIRGGEVFVTGASCPGGDCMAHAPISKAGESIVCLPNRLIVRITGEASGPDAVTGGADL